MSTSRSRRTGDGLASVSRGQGGKDHTYLTVKMPSSKLRQATSSRQGSSIAVNSETAPKRSTRGGKKSYVVESDSDEEEEEGEDEIQVGAPAVADDDEDEEMEDDVDDDDAEGEEDDMGIDAEGEDDEDAEGDEDDVAPTPGPSIKISKPIKKSPESKKTKNPTPQKAVQFSAPNDSDDDELSELESDEEMDIDGDEDAEGDEDDEEMDAEGDEIEEDQEVEAEPEPGAEAAPRPEDLGSDDDTNGSRGGTPDLTRMTVRQRARFEEVEPSHYQALSNGMFPSRICVTVLQQDADPISFRRGASQEGIHSRGEGHAPC